MAYPTIKFLKPRGSAMRRTTLVLALVLWVCHAQLGKPTIGQDGQHLVLSPGAQVLSS